MDLSKFLGLSLPETSASGKKISKTEKKRWRKRIVIWYLVICVVFLLAVIIAGYPIAVASKEFPEFSCTLFLEKWILVFLIIMVITRQIVFRERRKILKNDKLRKVMYG